MNLNHLATLKDKLIASGDFATIMDYFMTEFGDHEEFLRKGKLVRNQMLEAVLREVGKEVFSAEPAVVLNRVRFVEISAYHFTHGGLLLNGCVSTMFYFADVQMGMLAVAMSIIGPAKFLRFSGKLLSPNLAASDN